MHIIYDIFFHLLRHYLHKFLIISLSNNGMHKHQSFYPLYLTTTPNFLENDLDNLILLLLIFAPLLTFLSSSIDVNVNLIVYIVMDVNIYVDFLSLLFWTWFHTLLCQLDQRFWWYHIMSFIDFTCWEELLDFWRTYQSAKHSLKINI